MFCVHLLSISLRKIDFSQQFLKARVAAQKVDARISFELNYLERAAFISAVPISGLTRQAEKLRFSETLPPAVGGSAARCAERL